MASAGRMKGSASAVGMMDGAFFVSRTDLLTWVNQSLQLNLTKVEQCASGVVYCQIIDLCHPGSIAMKKLNWNAKMDHEFIPNFKVLQAAFDKNNIQRHIDVDKLIRQKYQDNLEFLQFMKCYWEREGCQNIDYDPIKAREGKPLPAWARTVGLPRAAAPTARAPAESLLAGEKENCRPRPANNGVASGGGASGGKAQPGSKPGTGRGQATPQAGYPTGARRPTTPAAAVPCSSCATKVCENEELRSLTDSLERERDFYFRKLREVEILCTTLQAKMEPSCTVETLLADIQGILYEDDSQADEELRPENIPVPDGGIDD